MTDIELYARAEAVACYPAVTYAMKKCAPDLAATGAEIQAFYSLPGSLEPLRRKGLLHRADYLRAVLGDTAAEISRLDYELSGIAARPERTGAGRNTGGRSDGQSRAIAAVQEKDHLRAVYAVLEKALEIIQ